MNEQELLQILEEGEGQKIEFKESLANLDKELVAFANASGGRIFVGITDGRKIKGAKISNRLKSQIQDTAGNCDPKVEIDLESFEDVLIIIVKEGEDKPNRCGSGFYRRVGVVARVEEHLVRFSACPFLLSIEHSHLSIAVTLLEVADSLGAIVQLR